MPIGVELAAYRIVQEALTNIRKHAGTARAVVVVRHSAGALELSIENDGATIAVNGSGASAGHGVIGMRERVALYGGEIAVGPRAEGGYAVLARLPVDSVSA